MSVARLVVLAAVVVLFSALHSSTQQTPAGDFQIVPAQVTINSAGATWESHTAFLVDSKDGQVWEYIPAGKTSDGKFHDSSLYPVKRLLP